MIGLDSVFVVSYTEVCKQTLVYPNVHFQISKILTTKYCIYSLVILNNETVNAYNQFIVDSL